MIIPWLVTVWVLWPHLEYVDEKYCWKKCCNVVMAVFFLPVFAAVVAIKYLADCFMFLNRLEISLQLKNPIKIMLKNHTTLKPVVTVWLVQLQ